MAEVHNWLGFAYRAETSYAGPRTKYQEKGYAHYHKSLALNAGNFGTWGYLGQLYVLQGDRARAELCLDTLCRAVGPSHHSTEVVIADFRSSGWEVGDC